MPDFVFIIIYQKIEIATAIFLIMYRVETIFVVANMAQNYHILIFIVSSFDLSPDTLSSPDTLISASLIVEYINKHL